MIFKSDVGQSGGYNKFTWKCIPRYGYEPTTTTSWSTTWSTTTSSVGYTTTPTTLADDSTANNLMMGSEQLPHELPVGTTPPLTKVVDMAQARLTGRFKPSMAMNYGCAGRGYFDPFDQTIGKQVDETDKAFYSWKKCVQCALSSDGATPLINPDGGIPAYQYEQLTDSCG